MEDVRVCYIGDSFVKGIGDPNKLGWAGRLSHMSQNSEREITHYNLGVRGNSSADILARWESEAKVRLPNFSINCIVFSFGVNDTIVENGRARVSIAQSMKNLRNILGVAKVKYNVLMIGPPPIDDERQNNSIKSYDGAYATVCNMLGVNYLSIFDKLINDEVWMSEVKNNDHAHPRENGYELLSQYIYDWDGWWFA
jgi:lysophospholipase L1-like esterase